MAPHARYIGVSAEVAFARVDRAARLRHRSQIEDARERQAGHGPTCDADQYGILGLGPEAERVAIRQAYLRAIVEVRQGGVTERARLVEEAHAVLLDPVARAAYDARCVGHDLIEETVAGILDQFEWEC